MPADVWTEHNDNRRTGANTDDAVLRWSNVDVSSFGKINELETRGFIWAQPLYVRSVRLGDEQLKDLIVVGTSQNWLYAFDANAPRDGEAIVWSHCVGTPVPSQSFANGAGDIYRSTIGILGTPVIDVERRTDGGATGTSFAIAMVFDADKFDASPDQAYNHVLLAIDLATGRPRTGKPSWARIAGQVKGSGYFGSSDDPSCVRVGDRTIVNTAFAANTAAIGGNDRSTDRKWPIADAIRQGNHDFVQFNSAMQLQRPGLLLIKNKLNSTIYSAFGARADQDPYHGWVFAHDADSLECRGIFSTSRGGRRSAAGLGSGRRLRASAPTKTATFTWARAMAISSPRRDALATASLSSGLAPKELSFSGSAMHLRN